MAKARASSKRRPEKTLEIADRIYEIVREDPVGPGMASIGVAESFIVRPVSGRGREHAAARFKDGTVKLFL